MRKPVMVRVKVEDDLRCRFQGAAWRSHHFPSQVLRLLMEKYVELEEDPYAVDLTVWCNFTQAAKAVTQAMPRKPPTFVYEDDDEVIRARKEGWASPGFGRW